jgi:hypothetical protein
VGWEVGLVRLDGGLEGRGHLKLWSGELSGRRGGPSPRLQQRVSARFPHPQSNFTVTQARVATLHLDIDLSRLAASLSIAPHKYPQRHGTTTSHSSKRIECRKEV